MQLLERRSVLPMATKKGGMFMQYHEASKLPMTDERDLPSRAAALAGAKKTEVRKRQEAADKAKTVAVGARIFHISKVCPHARYRTPPLPSPRPRPLTTATLEPRCARSSSAWTANGRACSTR